MVAGREGKFVLGGEEDEPTPFPSVIWHRSFVINFNLSGGTDVVVCHLREEEKAAGEEDDDWLWFEIRGWRGAL